MLGITTEQITGCLNEDTSRQTVRNELKEALQSYITHTVECVEVVKHFCADSFEWLQMREKEQREIKRLDQEFQNSKQENQADLVELCQVLSSTAIELDRLHSFVDSVEKLALTSDMCSRTMPC
ncbi:hypothetical protein WMY93_030836 [Mugilogobius chulae]|uniref:Uncharacterized protein n=1 Tax=Mugilogobius chulae TaxID=88201 RepID=A0AAW0MF15_9GOBI